MSHRNPMHKSTTDEVSSQPTPARPDAFTAEDLRVLLRRITSAPPDEDVTAIAINELRHFANTFCRRLPDQSAELETLRSDWQKIVRVALECNPMPACKQDDNKLEPPWEVFARLSTELAQARRRVAQLEKEAADSITSFPCRMTRETYLAYAQERADLAAKVAELTQQLQRATTNKDAK